MKKRALIKNTNKLKLLFIFAIIVFLMAPICIKYVTATGIASRSAQNIVDFHPNTQVILYYSVTSADKDVQLSIRGDLANITELSKDYIGAEEKDKSFTVTINFPDKIDVPGKHGLSVVVGEALSTTGSVGTSVQVHVSFYIRVPYPGRYIETSLSTNNAAINETVKFSLQATNRGDETINDLRAKITIYDSDNNFIDSFYTNQKSAEPGQTADLTAGMGTVGMLPGDYAATADVFYPGKNQSTANFRIGAQQIQVINFTEYFFYGKINQFEVQIFNDWNKAMGNIYAELLIGSNSYKTPVISLIPWTYGTMQGYLDATGYTAGRIPATLKIYYPEGVIEKQIEIEFVEKKESIKESPKFLNTTTILGAVIAVLILITLGLIIKMRKMSVKSSGIEPEKEAVYEKKSKNKNKK